MSNKNKMFIFLALSLVTSCFSVFCGDIINNLYVGASTRIYPFPRTVNYPFLENTPITEIHLEFFNVFFAILFAIFLGLSVYFGTKNNRL